MIMKIPSQNLSAFYVLSQELNFTRAAKLIGLSQPAFSQRIMALEQFFETTLIIREKNNIRLTNAGVKLLRHCQTIFQMENDIIFDLTGKKDHNQISGEIRIGGFSSVMRSIAIPTLALIANKHIGVSVKTMTKELYELPELLFSAKVDFILLNRPILKEGIKNILVGHETLVEITTKNAKDVYLDHDEFDETTIDFLKKYYRDKRPKRSYLDDVYSIYEGVKLGMGSAIYPKHLITDKKIIVKNPNKTMKSPVYLVTHDLDYQTKLHQLTEQKLIESFSKSLS